MMVGWVVTNSNHPEMGQTSEIMDTDLERWNLADLWLAERQEKVTFQTSSRVHALPKRGRRCHMVFAIWNRLFWNKSHSTKPLFTHWRAKLSFSPLQEPKQHSEMTLQKQLVGNPGTIIHVGWSKEFGSIANWLHQKLVIAHSDSQCLAPLLVNFQQWKLLLHKMCIMWVSTWFYQRDLWREEIEKQLWIRRMKQTAEKEKGYGDFLKEIRG